MFKSKLTKGFTILELLVVVAVLAIIATLTLPQLESRINDAKHAKLLAESRQLETAIGRYYMDYGDWPRLSDTPYTSAQVTAFAQKIYDTSGKEVALNPSGNYYEIDYSKLDEYTSMPSDKASYILQNPVGKLFALKGLTAVAQARLDAPASVPATIDLSSYSAILYVATTGNDTTGSGTESNPYKTIAKAIDRITVDNTAVKIAPGTYNESSKNVPGSYDSREYALVRSTPNKSYSLVGDRQSPPLIMLSSPVAPSFSNYVVQQQASTVTKVNNYGMYDLKIKLASNFDAVISDLSCGYANTVTINNVVIDTTTNTCSYIAYFNGGIYGTSANIQVNVNNSVLMASSNYYNNGNGILRFKDSIVKLTSGGLGSYLTQSNSIFWPTASVTSGVYAQNPSLDANYKITNVNQVSLPIGVYYGTHSWLN